MNLDFLALFVGCMLIIILMIVNEANQKSSKQRNVDLTERHKEDELSERREQMDAKRREPCSCIVSLLPPNTSFVDNELTDYWEKDVYLDTVSNRDEAFALMRDYLECSRIKTTDVSELMINIYDSRKRLVETASAIQFTLGDEFISFNYDTMLCEGALFLIRFASEPKYKTIPALEDWGFDKRTRFLSEQSYRDLSNYLKSKEGDN